MVSVERTTDASLLRGVLEHESVRPWVVADGVAVDSELVGRLLNGIVLAVYLDGSLAGAFCFQQVNPAVYQIHTNLLPQCRGRLGIAAAREAILWMYANTMALRVVTMVPDFNPAARRFAVDSGMRSEYRRQKCYPWGGVLHDAEWLAFDIHEWIWHHATHFARLGHQFHEQIERLNSDAGLESHEDDFAHDAMVGAAMALHMAGATGRGVGLYNEWAVVSGYAALRVISDHPEAVVVSMLGLTVRIGRDGRVSAGE